MASWSELRHLLRDSKSIKPIRERLQEQLQAISERRDGAAVLFYASAFLQKDSHHGTEITREDMNGFMDALYRTSTDKGLVLILHTPGGNPNAVESIVEYLHSKFEKIHVVVPYLAMSGGAMISLASDMLIFGRLSQLGPIDPQLVVGNRTHSARAIQEGFARAKRDVQRDMHLAHFWAPILQNMGPSLMVEAEKALSYSKELVVKWLNRRMFKDIEDETEKQKKVGKIARYFNAEEVSDGQVHVHGQRIGVEKLRELGVRLELLEEDQGLQDDVFTAYHLMTLIFENSPVLKFIAGADTMWAKQHLPTLPQILPQHIQQQPSNILPLSA